MTEIPPPAIDFRYFNEQGIRVDPDYHERFGRVAASVLRAHEPYQQMVDALAAEKPNEFIELENQARRFLGSLAITDIPDLYLLEDGPELALVDEDPDDQYTYGFTPAWLAAGFIRQPAFERCRRLGGSAEAAGILVHELFHVAAQPIRRMTLRVTNKGAVGVGWRSGFSTEGGSVLQGVFFEEGAASWIEGWYRRCQDDPLAPAVPNKTPMLQLPKHYRPSTGCGAPSRQPMYGPDGYAMELLALGSSRRDAVSANEFACALLESRSEMTQTAALRTIASATESVQAGLYPYLRRLQYDRADWQRGFERVYHSVVARG